MFAEGTAEHDGSRTGDRQVNAGDCVKRVAGWTAVGLQNVLGRRVGHGLGILVYHRTSPLVRGFPAPEMNVTPERFEQQLVGLQRRGFQFISLRQALAGAADGDWPGKPLVVTFDDGFGNVFLHAWPILRRLQIPATIFLNTAFLDQESAFPFDPWAVQNQNRLPEESYRPLRVEECRKMLAHGLIEFGAHTHTHRNFSGKPEEFRADMRVCLECLDALFEIRRPTFAFPFGRVALGLAGGELTAAARALGVNCALTTECHMNPPGSDPFFWGRFNAYQWDTDRTLEAKLAGTYGWIPRLHERLTVRCRAQKGTQLFSR
jgi:peptidoglycan/xylan/chitin deacetylase (PgdA/CDA1 family)